MLPDMADPLDDPFAASHSVHRNQVAFTLLVPTLTSWANGMIATLMSSSFLVAFLSVSSRLFAAFLSSVILLLEDIDPVLSSASASSSFLMPHLTWEFT